MDTKQMTVDEIRKILIDKCGLEEDKVNNTKGKSALVELLQQYYNSKEISYDLEPTEDVIEVDDIPDMYTPEWHDYIMCQFTKEELMDGNPTVDGLRRVAQLILGPIRSIFTNVLQVPDPVNERRSTVIVSVKFDDSQFDGSGDAYWGNTDEIFRNFPVSVAETRAEGRALKRALGLRKINAAEEIAPTVNHNIVTENVEDGPITPTQIQFIDLMCSKNRLNINVNKLLTLLNMGEKVKDLKHKDALNINILLTKYQNQEVKIPDEITGYQPNWSN